MKKFLFLAPLLTLMLLLSGCGKKEVTPDDTTAQPGRPAVENAGNTGNTDDVLGDETTGDTEEDLNGTTTEEGDTEEDNEDGDTPSLDLKLPPLKVIPLDMDDEDDDSNPPLVIPDLEKKLVLPVQDSVGPLPPIEEMEVPQL